MQFGALRVLNDDTLFGGKGFSQHPHDNMEIITIPLSGALKHKDNMGNSSVIEQGDIQVMSAGSGLFHSEMNANKDEEVKVLQIWILPNKMNVEPRYDQISLEPLSANEFHQIVSPNQNEAGCWIHQNAWIHIGKFEKGQEINYSLKDKSNGVYLFVLEGAFEIEEQELKRRDALGVWNKEKVSIKSKVDSKILLIEVPME